MELTSLKGRLYNLTVMIDDFQLCNLLLLLSILVLLCLDIQGAFSVQWQAKDFPDPQRDLQKCGRNGKQSYVCDPDGVVSYKEGIVSINFSSCDTHQVNYYKLHVKKYFRNAQ